MNIHEFTDTKITNEFALEFTVECLGLFLNKDYDKLHHYLEKYRKLRKRINNKHKDLGPNDVSLINETKFVSAFNIFNKMLYLDGTRELFNEDMNNILQHDHDGYLKKALIYLYARHFSKIEDIPEITRIKSCYEREWNALKAIDCLVEYDESIVILTSIGTEFVKDHFLNSNNGEK